MKRSLYLRKSEPPIVVRRVGKDELSAANTRVVLCH